MQPGQDYYKLHNEGLTKQEEVDNEGNLIPRKLKTD